MKTKKVEKFVTNLHDQSEYVIHIRNLKQALNHRVILKKVNTVIKFNQNLWLKSYIDINSKLRQKAKLNFEKDLFKLMDNAIFRKTKGSVIKLRLRERRRNYLVS